MRQPFENMPTVLTSEEIISKSFKDAERHEIELSDRLPDMVKARKREASRIKAGEKATAGYLESVVKSVPTLDNIHPFYRDVLEILVGLAVAKAALGRLSRTSRIIHEAGRTASQKLRAARSPSAAAAARRGFFGRAASLLRDAEDDLKLIADMREKMKDLPTADPSMPTVVFAGYPGVGKSTIVRQLSSAKPEIRVYPFTTQEIIIGHANVGGMMIQMVDTPGILDRPLEKRNKTELLSITALGELASIIVFLVDVSEANGFTISSQRSLHEEVGANFPGRPILVFFNKTDVATPTQLEEAESRFGERDMISAIKGEGLNVLLKRVRDAVASSHGV